MSLAILNDHGSRLLSSTVVSSLLHYLESDEDCDIETFKVI